MTKMDINTWRRVFLFARRMVQLVAAAAVFTGCDFRNKEPETVAAVAKPSAASEAVSETSLPANGAKVHLVAGQTEAEVRQLLGEPSGRISASRRTVLLYSGEPLEFIDDRLTASAPDIQERIAAKNRTASPEISEPGSEAESGIKRAFHNNSVRKTPAAEKKAKQFVLLDERNRAIDHSRLTVPGKITVVDFYATWCGPCRQMAPVLEKMVQGQADVVLRKVDIGDWGSETASRYNVKSVPNVRVFDKKGRLVSPPSSNSGAIARNIERARNQE